MSRLLLGIVQGPVDLFCCYGELGDARAGGGGDGVGDGGRGEDDGGIADASHLVGAVAGLRFKHDDVHARGVAVGLEFVFGE